MELEKQVTGLALSKRLKELNCRQDSLWWWINSSYSSGWEGGEIIWMCDNEWSLYNFPPNPELDATGKITKKEGLIPDYCIGNPTDNHREKMKTKVEQLSYYSAYTTSELGEMLPANLELENAICGLKISKNHYLDTFTITYTGELGFEERNMADCIAKMLCWLIENKKIVV